MKKEIAAIYCRLSVEDAEKRAAESESIRNQRALLLGYAKKQGWAVYDIYADEDYSGLREDRPAFQRLLTDAEERKFSIILCKTQSRFTRNAGTAEKYLHALFPLWGVRFVTVVDGVDTASHANKKARQINSLVNEWYSEELSGKHSCRLSQEDGGRAVSGQLCAIRLPQGSLLQASPHSRCRNGTRCGRNL